MKRKLSTKNIYLLIGGGCHQGIARDNLSEEILGWLDIKKISKAKIIFVPFARYEVDRKRTIDKFKKSILFELLHSKRASVSVAHYEQKRLLKQLSEADIIIFIGGSEIPLIKAIKRIPFPKTDKIIIGSSAGTNFLSKYYYSNDRSSVEKGLGILPINTICHYTSDKNNKAIVLASKNKYSVLTIQDDHYISLIA